MEKKYIDKLAYIYLQDKKILVTLSKGKDTWYIPGGKREEGESDAEALLREVQEELAVQLKEDTMELYGIFEAPAHGKSLGTLVRMTCYTAEPIGTFVPSSEIAEIDLFPYSLKHKTSEVDHLIMEDLYQNGLIE